MEPVVIFAPSLMLESVSWQASSRTWLDSDTPNSKDGPTLASSGQDSYLRHILDSLESFEGSQLLGIRRLDDGFVLDWE